MTTSRYLHCLYAEEVRQETSGQATIVGMFQGGLRAPALPTTIVKLAILATLFLPRDEVPKSLVLEVLLYGKVINTMDIPSPFINEGFEAKKESAEYVGHAIQLVVGFANFPVTEPGKLEVRANVDGVLLSGNGLVIEVASESTEKRPVLQLL
ncbi:hypothetical protein [Acidovorax sp. Root217]|uniref:DUF6941 family protein n=1 Tax=Acidovorax sp. Root217 TaxID=1736492 RepID=UPI0007099722|nr:hypothetical protein [Acidovorax sp. Root217]KRC30666.1 hypothetical protein ASE31_00310 [Acidovorax sp. Root217]